MRVDEPERLPRSSVNEIQAEPSLGREHIETDSHQKRILSRITEGPRGGTPCERQAGAEECTKMRFACRVKEDPASGGKSSGPLGPPTPDFLECDHVTGARDPADDLFDRRHNPGKAVNVVCGNRYRSPVHYSWLVFEHAV